MQALILPAQRGPRWLIEGFSIFRQSPALLTFLALGYLLSMAVVLAIPLVGQALGFILVPVFSVSFMNACRRIDRKEALSPRVLFSGFHRNLPSLLALGIIYVLLMLSTLSFSALFDEGLLFRRCVMGEEPPRELVVQNNASRTVLRIPGGASLSDIARTINDSGAGVSAKLVEDEKGQHLVVMDTSGAARNDVLLKLSFASEMMLAFQVAAVTFIPVLLAFWFAPVLAAWHGMTAGKSLFFSLVACLRNWRPFVLYWLALSATAFLAARLLGTLFPPSGQGFQAMAAMILCLVFLPILYAGHYMSYRDIFAGIRDVA